MQVYRTPLRPKEPLKKILDRFYRDFDFRERLRHDPLEFPHRYSNPADIEAAGFISACFAYGRVDLFKPVIEKILKPCGNRPGAYFLKFSLKREMRHFQKISYRFNREEDILCFIYILHRVLKKWGSLRDLFYHFYQPDHTDIRTALEGFINYILAIDTRPVYGKNIKPKGLLQLLPSPKRGSACKRMNLFLRWMVRRKDIDLGIWERIPPSKLIIPLDTHISRISRCLGLTDRTASDWKTAQEITASLRRFDPLDPLKYDFALCHQGISGLCRGEARVSVCSGCIFAPLKSI